jgi:hypothetical protein
MIDEKGFLRTHKDKSSNGAYLFFNFPFGETVVIGGVARSENPEDSFAGPMSFLGFCIILLLRCSPLGTSGSWLFDRSI